MPRRGPTGGSKFGQGGFENPRVRGQTIGGGPKKASGGPNVTSDPSSPCLISWPSASLPLVGSVGGGCMLSKSNVRAFAGAGLIIFGGLILIPATVILAAAGLGKTGIAGKAADAAGVIPGYGQAVSVGLRGLQSASNSPGRAATQRRARRASSERETERRAGEPRENRELRTGRGAVRESSAGTRERRRNATPAPRTETGF